MDDSLQSRMELIKKENTKFFKLHSETNDIWAKLVEITRVCQGGMQSLAAQQLYKLCYSDITKKKVNDCVFHVLIELQQRG